MEKKAVALIFIPPGKKDAVPDFFIDKLGSTNVINIEKKLLSILNANSMHEAITANSRNKLEYSWRYVINGIVDKLNEEKENPSLTAIVCHAVYYNNNTREFFSVFDASYFKKLLDDRGLRIERTALIIDDIFDSLRRLREKGKLYSDAGLTDYIIGYSKMMRITFEQAKVDPKAHLSWLHYCLNSILKWRSQEMILANSIAKELQSEFVLWGLKQDGNILLKWLQDVKTELYYVSHPISEPRRILGSTTKWPPLVEIINSLQMKLNERGLLTLMPTAIDELRFEKEIQEVEEKGIKVKKHAFTARLTKRWPLPSHLQSPYRHLKLIGDDIDHLDILSPKVLDGEQYELIRETNNPAKVDKIRDFIDGVLTSLEMSIYEEIGNRDHHLVWHTNGILVIDPYSADDDKIHGGVKKELRYLRAVNIEIKKSAKNRGLKWLEQDEEKPRKLCAILLRSTLQRMMDLQDFKPSYIEKLRQGVVDDYPTLKIARFLDSEGRLKIASGSLGMEDFTAPMLTRLTEKLPEYRKSAVIFEFIARTLSMDPDDLDYIDIIIIDNYSDLTQESILQRIVKVMAHDQKELEWKKEIIELVKKSGIIID